jgi:hypothetical protein
MGRAIAARPCHHPFSGHGGSAGARIRLHAACPGGQIAAL